MTKLRHHFVALPDYLAALHIRAESIVDDLRAHPAPPALRDAIAEAVDQTSQRAEPAAGLLHAHLVELDLADADDATALAMLLARYALGGGDPTTNARRLAVVTHLAAISMAASQPIGGRAAAALRMLVEARRTSPESTP